MVYNTCDSGNHKHGQKLRTFEPALAVQQPLEDFTIHQHPVPACFVMKMATGRKRARVVDYKQLNSFSFLCIIWYSSKIEKE